MRTTYFPLILLVLFLAACAQQQPTTQTQDTATSVPASNPTAATASGGEGAVVAAAQQPDPVELDPAKGQEIGSVYEAFLSPHQEPGEEKDTPALTPDEFRSTAPSLLRNERQSHGHGVIRFTNDLSRVYVDVELEGVKLEDVVMFHIHCGKPDMLGPIIVDFAQAGNLQENIADGVFSAVITNEVIEQTAAAGHGLVGAFTSGCPINPAIPMDKVKTIAGLETIARQGELYFNLHTKGQVFYGDIRGQLHLVEEE